MAGVFCAPEKGRPDPLRLAAEAAGVTVHQFPRLTDPDLSRYPYADLHLPILPGTDVAHNPNGSANDIAGICNAAGPVVGFMPHPERLAEASLGSEAGHRCFTSLISRLTRSGVAA